MKQLTLCLFIFCAISKLPAEYQSSNSAHHVSIELLDGSIIKGTTDIVEVRVDTEYGFVYVDLSKLNRIEKSKDLESVSFFMKNGDRIKGFPSLETIEVKSLVGDLKVAMNDVAKIHKILDPSRLQNVALHKKVITEKKMSAHAPTVCMTDGKNVFPPARAEGPDFVAVVDLQKTSKNNSMKGPSDSTFRIDEIVLNWAFYGSKITDTKNRVVYNYIREYKVEYRTTESNPDNWELLHSYKGVPIMERNKNVSVKSWIRKSANQEEECVKTTLRNLNLDNVKQFRVTAKSFNHFIGIYEFEAYGVAE